MENYITLTIRKRFQFGVGYLIFSYYLSVFKSAIFFKFEIVICKFFQFGRV